MQDQLNFSRDMEREADRVGFGVMTAAGFAPAGLAAMFEKLQYASRLNDNGAFPYLRTHPLTVERIAEARSPAASARAAGEALRGRASSSTPSPSAGTDPDGPRVDALRRWQGRDADHEGTPPTSCSPRTRARWRRTCCATGRGPSGFAKRSRSCAQARTAVRAPSARSPDESASLLDRGAPRRRPRR